MSNPGTVTALLLIVLLLSFFAVTFVGFKLLFYPLILIKRLASRNMDEFHISVKFLVILWTIALCPAPFIYLGRWVIEFARAVLLNGAILQSTIASNLTETCINADNYCLTEIGDAFGVFWTNSVLSAVQAFSIPDGLQWAGILFAIGVTAALFFTEARLLWIRQFSTSVNLGTAATLGALTISFAIAIYLAIIAIIAVPVFGQQIPDIAPLSQRLEKQLADLESEQKSKATPLDIDAILIERNKLPSDAFREQSVFPMGFGFPATSIWALRLDRWDELYKKLAIGVNATSSESSNFQREAKFFFMISNEGRVGETASQRHATRIADSFAYWQDRYNDNIRECAAVLQSELDRLKKFASIIGGSSKSANLQPVPFSFENDGLLGIQCPEIAPSTRDFLPQRTGPADSLGPFGVAAAWLLQTENQELALITGLLGFGFFGALAAGFIREYTTTPGTEMPQLGFIIPAFIRGISAAVLVFLLTKGGTAILTKGEVSLNAYAIFFACFVAAVFSEDVWTWARRRQSETFPTRPQDEVQADSTDGQSKSL